MAPKPERGAALPGLDRDPLSFLVDDAAVFLQRHWERKPVVLRASTARTAFFNGLFSWGELQRLAAICDEEGEPLEFGVDVNAARYVGGRRETPNGEVADAKTLKELYRKEGCTMQVHQPQRFSDELWRLLAALEGQLGCLVGCNAYLTPAGTQGLAPHWDDVEIFVVQTQGSKRWRLYAPDAPPADAADAGAGAVRACLLASSHLANQVSGDLLESEIGEPSMEFTLEVGDALYMPRGCIHQAVAQEGDSAHLTISTYQRWSFADLLQHAVSVALANPTLQPLMPQPLKAGLPLRWLSAAGMGPADAARLAAASGGFGDALPALVAQAGGSAKAGGSSKAGLARQLADACRAMAEWLEDEELGPRVVEAAAGAVMAEDFMRSRLPPHPVQLPPRGPAPTLKDAVQCVGSGLFRLVPLSGSGSGHEHGGCGSDCEEDHEHGHAHHDHAEGEACGAGCAEAGHDHASGSAGAPPAWVRLVSCLHNDRDSHMMSGGDDEESDEEEAGSSDEEEGGSDSEGEELEAGADQEDAEEEASDHAASDSDGDHSEGGDMQVQLQRLAAAAGSKRKEMEAQGPASSDEEDAEENGSEDEDQGGSSDDDEEQPEDLVFPAEFAPALVQLLGSAPDAGESGGGRPIPVNQIALPDPELQLQVAAALWDAGVLCTVKAPAKQQKQKQQGAAKQKQQKQAGGKRTTAAAAAAAAKGKKQRKA
ncbi:bifunctional lysine-specific demethylase and histidyl-hydroxylase MINA [Chlorella sorokiniana]|uniref:Bifunctional lysine-specific demethylase and histidyl-hydroxylase n=1 Tax=Chlorella sorokiniana TaxID=3076 RepID=A0A2P6U4P4_CHLSO|nr:bifunctional lysine-specific demethylase and histidyl-hydroxylase MINA [Chlorella sorokiniana]|eukprot:PRW61282.1 bifunctional lysine-specific demethylase and histidyl-hydroxylase MINA [Chlorella sorokiniana]